MKETGAEMLQAIASQIWQASWQGSLLALLVVFVQWAFRRVLPARWLSALWLIVMIRLLMPVLPETSWNPAGCLRDALLVPPRTQAASQQAGPAVGPDWWSNSSHPSPELPARERTLPPTAVQRLDVRGILSGVWLGVACLLIVRMVVAHRQWTKRAIARRGEIPTALREVFEAIKSELRVVRTELLLTRAVTSPLVSGLWRTRIFLPVGIEGRLSIEELRLVLCHEMGHVKRGDTWVAWLSGFVVSLHWFNPLIYVAMARSRHDRETACDEWVLSHGHAPGSYGAALVRILEFGLPKGAAAALGAVGMFETKAALFSRVRGISAYQPSSWKATVGGGALVAGLGLCALTSSGDEKPRLTAVGFPSASTGNLSSGFAALKDFYEQEAGIWVLRGSRWRGGRIEIPMPEENRLRLTNDGYQFAIKQEPSEVYQGTGDYAPCPPALFDAIDDRKPATVRALLRTIATPNLPAKADESIFEPLDYAVHALVVRPDDGRLREVIKVLLEFGANPNSPRIDRRSLLFAPVKNGQFDLVAFLLSVGIDPRKGGDGGVAVMEEAELHGAPAMKSLIQKAFDKSADAYGASKLW